MDHPKDQKSVSKLDQKARYRVFISYSHEDIPLVKRIAAILERNGLWSMWDRNFVFGQGFHEQIKNYIAHAHVFMPILTKTANKRKWVHQEIGYAMAMHTPVLPIAVGGVPGEMIQLIQALRLKGNDPERISSQLTREMIEMLIESHADNNEALYECAELTEDRARMMSSYADDVFRLGEYDVVRQKGALSSFHIPTETIKHPVWRRRYGPVEKSEEHCRLQRRERFALHRHAIAAGCKLIVNPNMDYQPNGPDARICRLECLLQFLNNMADEFCRVAVDYKMEDTVSQTLLGNWFSAESFGGKSGEGYRQTIFTRHAPTVKEKVVNFDSEFDELLKAAGVKPGESRRWAIAIIEKIVSELKAQA